MQTNLDKYKTDIDSLLKEGNFLYGCMVFEQSPEDMEKLKKALREKHPNQEREVPKFSERYQLWYSEALECLRQLLPGRVDDFVKLYKPDIKRKELNAENYSVSDYLLGLSLTFGSQKVVGPEAAIPKFRQQLKIVESLKRRFESTLFDIRSLVQADLFDSELDAARELNKKGFARGAGAMAGGVLERHLSKVCDSHKVKITKKDPSINDHNQPLKDSGVIDITQWRFIGHLADLRNLCDHDKKREPKREEIDELISGVEKVIKTIF